MTAAAPGRSEPRRQVFLDPGGRRARITDIVLTAGGGLALAVASVLLIGLLCAPVMRAPETPQPIAVAPARAMGLLGPWRPEPPVTARGPRPGPIHADRQMRLAFFYGYGHGDYASLAENAAELDGIVPRWIEVGTGPQGPELRIARDQDRALRWLNENAPRLPVYPEFGGALKETDWTGSMARPAVRAVLVERIAVHLKRIGASGLALNATAMPAQGCRYAEAFLREWSARTRDERMKSFVVASPDEKAACLRALADAADYVVIATHDESRVRHGAGAPAGQGWFEASLRRVSEAVPPSRLVVAVGSYAVDVAWTGASAEIPVQRAWDILSRHAARLDVDGAMNPTFEYVAADGGRHRVWMLDAVTAFNQARFAMALPIAGVALWRMGLEDPGAWRSLGRGRSPSGEALRALERPGPGYGNYRFMDGGVLFAAGADRTGRRALAYDGALGLIADQRMEEVPMRGEIGVWRAADPKAVALTFDDGPDPRYTGRILDILKERGVPATFYVAGRNVLWSPDLVRRMYREGHDVGSNTFARPDPFGVGTSRFEVELNATQRVLQAMVGIETNLFRPPYAGSDLGYLDADPKVVQTAARLGYVLGGMDVESCGFCGGDAAWVAEGVLDAVRRGGRVVHLQDGGGDREATVAALPAMIDALRGAGYRLVATHELAGLPREKVLRRWHPLALLADLENAVWSGALNAARSLAEFWPTLMVWTAILGISRLAVVALLAAIQWRFAGRRPSAEPYRGAVDVLVPAYDEEKVICRTVESLLASRLSGASLRIVVIDDGSKDRTSDVVREGFPDEERLLVLRKENGGKAAALNYGIARSSAEVIVAIDGDTILLPDAVDRLVSRFSDPGVGAVAGNVVVGNRINLLTRFQALEYATCQNLDRRAFELLRAVGVVPGAIGAWRRTALIEAGGYAHDTMAEDADLTFAVQIAGWKVLAEPRAVALTEAPETLRAFMKQRFRWMFGTMQVVFKHAGTLVRRPSGVALVAVPNVLVFQVLFTLLAPVVDVLLVWSLVAGFYIDMPGQAGNAVVMAKYWLLFQAADCAAAAVGIALGGDRGLWRLVPLLLLQRFTYRQLLYVTAIRSLLAAVKGTLVGWGKLVRTGNVKPVPASAGS